MIAPWRPADPPVALHESAPAVPQAASSAGSAAQSQFIRWVSAVGTHDQPQTDRPPSCFWCCRPQVSCEVSPGDRRSGVRDDGWRDGDVWLHHCSAAAEQQRRRASSQHRNTAVARLQQLQQAVVFRPRPRSCCLSRQMPGKVPHRRHSLLCTAQHSTAQLAQLAPLAHICGCVYKEVCTYMYVPMYIAYLSSPCSTVHPLYPTRPDTRCSGVAGARSLRSRATSSDDPPVRASAGLSGLLLSRSNTATRRGL